ncbi:hypothetical protein [Kineococcus esterisolvens]|uniref:hypothetical protein n=1 Tax=unclassified Kineococcus TaxID=2621656 RepID=UPI003D7D03DC
MAMPKTFWRGQASSGTWVTAVVPGDKLWVITNIALTNTGSSDITAFVHLDGTPLVSGLLIKPQKLFALDVKQPLEAGKNLRVAFQGSGVMAGHVAGVEMNVDGS